MPAGALAGKNVQAAAQGRVGLRVAFAARARGSPRSDDSGARLRARVRHPLALRGGGAGCGCGGGKRPDGAVDPVLGARAAAFGGTGVAVLGPMQPLLVEPE